MDNKDLIGKIKALNFSVGEYAVVGSAVLEVLGIKKSKDTDILVSDNLFEKLKLTGKYQQEERYGKLFLLSDNNVDISNRFFVGNYNPDEKILINSSFLVEGVPFVQLEEIIKFKKEIGSEKDLLDIKLIEEYLKTKQK